MADLMRYQLEDGSEVMFEFENSTLVDSHGGGDVVHEGGRLAGKLAGITAAAQQVAQAMREKVEPGELQLELGVKIAGEVNAWFFAKQQGEATIKVTLTWKKDTPQP